MAWVGEVEEGIIQFGVMMRYDSNDNLLSVSKILGTCIDPCRYLACCTKCVYHLNEMIMLRNIMY